MLKRFIQSALRPLGYYLRSTTHFGDNYWTDLSNLAVDRHPQKQIIVDVGAHHGETLLAAREYFPAAILHCFEPDPESFGILQSCASALDDVILHPVALGAAPGKAEFHRNNESMTNSLLPTCAESLQSDYASLTKTKGVIEVPIDTLDAVCSREGIDWIDILKTDCQGYDLMVLQGGESMISSHKIGLITCEVIFDREYDGQGTYHELFKFLDSRGYRLMGFFNMARNAARECTFCDAVFHLPPVETAH